LHRFCSTPWGVGCASSDGLCQWDGPLPFCDWTLCLSVLLESDAGTTPECLTASQVLWEPGADSLPDNILEPIAETTPEVPFASHSLLQSEANKLKNELHDLTNILSNERTEFKKAIAELKMKVVDKISSAVIERITDVVHNSAEDVAGTGSAKFRIEEEGADSARSRWTVVDGLWGKVQKCKRRGAWGGSVVTTLSERNLYGI